MKKVIQIGFGALMIGLGVLMLALVFRNNNGGDATQGAIAPLGLIGAGALAISAARRPPKKW